MLKQLDPRFPYAVRSSSRAIAPSLPIPNPTMHLRARREIPRLRSQGREGGREGRRLRKHQLHTWAGEAVSLAWGIVSHVVSLRPPPFW